MRASELRKKSWNHLKGRYWMVFVATLIVMVVFSAASSLAGLSIIIAGPLYVGLAVYLLNIVETDSKGEKLELLLEGFKKNVGNAIIAYILTMLFIILWSLLLIIPGIIKALAYSQVFYILAEQPDMTPTEAIKKSQEMMKGHKMRLFLLMLSFLGWFILGALAFGVGIFFVLPYFQTTLANFYVDLRGAKKMIVHADDLEETVTA